MIAPLLAALLFSCGDSSLLFPQPEAQPAITIDTIDEGAVLEPGSSIPLSVTRTNVTDEDMSTADRMEIDIVDEEQQLVATQAFESVDLMDEIPSIAVPEIGDGYFTLEIRYYDGVRLIAERTVPFFVVDGSLLINGVSFYPTSFFPGSQGIVELRSVVPSGIDPYVQWWLDGELVDSGYLSAGLDRALVTSPPEEGVYPVTVELFPSGPAADTPFEFASPVRYRSQLFVSRDRDLSDTDLVPHESYLTLFHLQGDFRDSGARNDFDPNATMVGMPFGSPKLRIDGDIFGYHLDGGSGFSVSSATIPYRDQRVSPFSITFRLRPASLTEDAQLMLVEDVRGTELLRLSADQAGFVHLWLGFLETAEGTTSVMPLLSAGETTTINVSVWPGPEATQVLWFKNGLLSSVSTVSGIGEESSVEESDAGAEGSPDGAVETAPADNQSDGVWSVRPGRTVVGGNDGLHGLIDEVGVYFRDEADQPSSDESIFSDAMHLLYGENLIYAEGFESQQLPEEIVAYGDVRVGSGALSIGSGGGIFVPEFPFGSEALIVEIDLTRQQPDARIRINLVTPAAADDDADAHEEPEDPAAAAADAADAAQPEAGEAKGAESDDAPESIELITVQGDGGVEGADTDLVGENGLVWLSIGRDGENLVAVTGDGTVLASSPLVPEEIQLEIANGGTGTVNVVVRSVLVHRAAPELGGRLQRDADNPNQ